MLSAGDLMPHFSIVDVDGRRVDYARLWQLVMIVLVSAGTIHATGDALLSAVHGRLPEFASDDLAVILTRDAIDGLEQPGVVVADRWGEIYYVSRDTLPGVNELLEWVQYIRLECPECQGEVR